MQEVKAHRRHWQKSEMICWANDQSALDEKTVSSYLDALRKIFVIEDMPAWQSKLTFEDFHQTTDTRYFVTLLSQQLALSIGPESL